MESVYKTNRGSAVPLGVSRKQKGINFSLFSEHAKEVRLDLFRPGEKIPLVKIVLDPAYHRTGHIWHIFIENLPEDLEYGYHVDGPHIPREGLRFTPLKILVDPYAKSLNTTNVWGNFPSQLLGEIILDPPFDWENTKPPRLDWKDLVIYEMHVRGFTEDKTSNSKHPGTFLGIIEKIPYLKQLGVNAVELMPIFEFNETEYVRVHPVTGEKLYNYWGYSTLNFFSPMKKYASSTSKTSAIEEFKRMVKELHRNGIEVILDVVFNHTSEGNENGPIYSFKGIDNSVYYLLDKEGRYKNYSGCGNTMNCNHPVVRDLILDALHYWVDEMHVDGFRFDLASILTRDENGMPMENPPIVKAISEDPLFANTKFIAEAWDAAGLYQVGNFPHFGVWAEWNGVFRDVVRSFLKGTDDRVGDFARAISGSKELYGEDREPYHSINFVTAHDGFTLSDLVTYQNKHNEDNGENNLDGANQNDNWNCGTEGPSPREEILHLRKKQMRNHHLALMVAIGTPMILMGDEYGHTRKGNNNTWCHDNELNWFLWDHAQKNEDFTRFYKKVINYRKNHPLLRREKYLSPTDVTWHGFDPETPDWSSESRFVAFTLHDPSKKNELYIAFNAYFTDVDVKLPLPIENKKWYRVIDTSLPAPHDFSDNPHHQTPIEGNYRMNSYSAILLEAF
jgi:isoamylase/glycogen operon protein